MKVSLDDIFFYQRGRDPAEFLKKAPLNFYKVYLKFFASLQFN